MSEQRETHEYGPEDYGFANAVEIIPGIGGDDADHLYLLARTLKATDAPTLQWALDEAYINPDSTSLALRTDEYRSDSPDLHTALEAAQSVARSGIALRITANPRLEGFRVPNSEVLDGLSKNKEFRNRQNKQGANPNDRQAFLFMQSRLLLAIAWHVANPRHAENAHDVQ